ncbi:hypothetical protein AWZ03_015027 [Drosophila navojoa]|uniref:Uncharacterized protein n=1 Tax=Drosophila navojoa TaxID=7232 RepID=A0A484AR37_DRONA|nr:hypothetical protein AWZ03_015027 [Drosophila navojoa]
MSLVSASPRLNRCPTTHPDGRKLVVLVVASYDACARSLGRGPLGALRWTRASVLDRARRVSQRNPGGVRQMVLLEVDAGSASGKGACDATLTKARVFDPDCFFTLPRPLPTSSWRRARMILFCFVPRRGLRGGVVDEGTMLPAAVLPP